MLQSSRRLTKKDVTLMTTRGSHQHAFGPFKKTIIFGLPVSSSTLYHSYFNLKYNTLFPVFCHCAHFSIQKEVYFLLVKILSCFMNNCTLFFMFGKKLCQLFPADDQ